MAALPLSANRASSGRRQEGLRIILAAVVCLALVVVNSRTTWLQQPRELIYEWVFQPVRLFIQAPLRFTSNEYHNYQRYHQAFTQVQSLVAQNDELRAQVQLLDHYQVENRRLRLLMDSVASVSEPVLVAELEDDEIEGYREVITLNKGSVDGVYLHQAVIDPYGLVGQVTEVYQHSAKVMLIVDGRSRVPVYVKRTQQRALVSGTSQIGVLTMPMMRLDSDIRVGDVLVSSGLGGVFPRGYPVAEVTAIQRNQSQAFMHVELRALAHLDTMLEVLLLDQRSVPNSNIGIPMGPPLPPDFKRATSAQERP